MKEQLSNPVPSETIEKNGVVLYHRHFDLGQFGPDIDDFANITIEELERLNRKRLPQKVYVNPEWSILATSKVPFQIFYREANTATVLWKRRLQNSFSRKVIDQAGRQMNFVVSQLAMNGVFFVDGKSMHPKKAHNLSQQK